MPSVWITSIGLWFAMRPACKRPRPWCAAGPWRDRPWPRAAGRSRLAAAARRPRAPAHFRGRRGRARTRGSGACCWGCGRARWERAAQSCWSHSASALWRSWNLKRKKLFHSWPSLSFDLRELRQKLCSILPQIIICQNTTGFARLLYICRKN